MKKQILRAFRERAMLQSSMQGEDPAEKTGYARVRTTGTLIGRRWRRRFRQLKSAYAALPAPAKARMTALIRRELQEARVASEAAPLAVAEAKPLSRPSVGLMVIAIASLAMLTGCDFPQTQYGPELTESAIVDDTFYSPRQHGSGVGYTFSSGKRAGGIAVTSVIIPQKYAVVFKCAHGKFCIEGSAGRHKALWERLQRGDLVTIRYREVFSCTSTYTNLVDLDFLDAKPQPSGVEK